MEKLVRPTSLPPQLRQKNQARVEEFYAFGILGIALLTMALIRLRLLNFPLERDEGEYAYAGQLILHGGLPYQDCYNMKWPGVYVAYAAIMAVFGETTAGIHLGLLLVSLSSALLVFLVGRKIGGVGMGAVAAATQALVSVNPSALGFAGHATHFVVLPALAGIWLLMARWERLRWGRCLGAGALLGIACIMKQQGAAFGLFAAIWLLWRGRIQQESGARIWGEICRRLGFLAGGGLLALLTMAIALACAGVYEKFWHWTVEYAQAYVGILTFSEGINNLAITGGEIWRASYGLWLLAVVGAVLLWFEPTLRRWRFFLSAFLTLSFAAVCPGYYFRNHYFLLFVPAASLLCGAAWCAWARSSARWLRYIAQDAGIKIRQKSGPEDRSYLANGVIGVSAALFLAAILQTLLGSYDVFFRLTPEQACRKVYGGNPFPESVEIARHIAENCPMDARIAILGSEPQICFYSGRRSATGYIYTYPLMEPQLFALEMQRDMIHEIEQTAPEYLVFVCVPTSWLARPDSDPTIFRWFRRYSQEQMQLDGVVEILSTTVTESQWHMAGRAFKPRSNEWLAIYKRKSNPVAVTIQLKAIE